MHGVMKIIHGWAESASTGLKLATVCMCVSFTSAESCANYSIPCYLLGVIQVVMSVAIDVRYQC